MFFLDFSLVLPLLSLQFLSSLYCLCCIYLLYSSSKNPIPKYFNLAYSRLRRKLDTHTKQLQFKQASKENSLFLFYYYFCVPSLCTILSQSESDCLDCVDCDMKTFCGEVYALENRSPFSLHNTNFLLVLLYFFEHTNP